jgi:type II secretory pathway pseudopilin PulG
MRHGVGHSGGSVGHTTIRVVVGLAVLGVIAAITIPKLLTAKGGHNDTAAIATLRHLAVCQDEFRKKGLVDLDGDGTGEFGTLGEMTGSAGIRTNADASTRGALLKPPILSPSLAGVTSAGIVTKSGYAFRVFLPGKDGGAVREGMAGGTGLPFTGPVDTDLAEKRWCAYAWPVAYGNSGTRAFFVDQEGTVWWTLNDTGRYSDTKGGPAWDAAMPASGTGWTPTDPKVKEYVGRDGAVWKKTW